MEKVTLVIQSKQDYREGKPLVRDKKLKDLEKCENLTIGILEGGTVSGQTTLMFCLEMKDGSVKVGEITNNHFEMLIGAVRGAVERFGNGR